MAVDAWLTILQAGHTGLRTWVELLEETGSAQALLAESGRLFAARGLPDDAIRRLRSPDHAELARWQSWLDAPARALITRGSPAYPKLLENTPGAPLALWLEGAHPELLHAPQIAIVGSRNPTITGQRTAERFARYLGERGFAITSGLATGIDGASHRGAIGAPGRTVAVLGSGIDRIFPRTHERLAREIAGQGLLVSEYPPATTARPFHFPQRNRIIAGLSLGTLVVEATRRSGALITAKRAGDYGREVFAVPGSIHSPLARGCHALIRDGAKLVEDGADILVELAQLLQLDLDLREDRVDTQTDASTFDDPAYAKLIALLDFAPTTIAELVAGSGLTAAELSSMLLVLELEGFVEALPGGQYSRLAKRSS